MNANLRNFALWVIIVLLLLALFTLFQNPGQRTSSQDIPFSQLLSDIDAGKVRDLGISRALQAKNPALHPALADGGFLTRDSRMVERKKYGHKKARRSFQFSKR